MSTATIWQALAAPYSAAKGVVFIDDTLSPNIDVNYLFYDSAAKSLTLIGLLNLTRLLLTSTVTSTVGAVTMNVAAGQAIIAAGASSVVITNNLITANSIVQVTLASNDTTAILKNAVCSAGAITVTTTAAVTANTKASFAIVG